MSVFIVVVVSGIDVNMRYILLMVNASCVVVAAAVVVAVVAFVVAVAWLHSCCDAAMHPQSCAVDSADHKLIVKRKAKA